MQWLRLSILVLPLAAGCSVYNKDLKHFEEPQTWLETVFTPEGRMETHVMLEMTPVKPDRNKEYYWYDQNRIHSTSGYIGGRLLHGETIRYDRQDRALEKQEYKKGLKHGAWVLFDINGKTQSITPWEEGEISGTAYYYNADGQLIRETEYRHGKKNGKDIEYQPEGGEKKITFYRDDLPVEKDPGDTESQPPPVNEKQKKKKDS